MALALEAELVIAGAVGHPDGGRGGLLRRLLHHRARRADEILTEIRFPRYTGWGSHYEKFNRTAQAWSMCAVAVALRVEGGTIAEARVGLTNMGTTPIRATGVEAGARRAAGHRGRRPRGCRARHRGHGGTE